MLVKVTRNDIKKGKKGDYKFCPVARALRKQLFALNISEISVGGHMSVINGTQFVTHPTRVKEFIEKFDNGELVKPFTFRIPVKV